MKRKKNMEEGRGQDQKGEGRNKTRGKREERGEARGKQFLTDREGGRGGERRR